jgi:hypothetical protein
MEAAEGMEGLMPYRIKPGSNVIHCDTVDEALALRDVILQRRDTAYFLRERRLAEETVPSGPQLTLNLWPQPCSE